MPEQISDRARNRATERRSPTPPAKTSSRRSAASSWETMPCRVSKPVVNAAEHAIHEIDQREKRNQHRADVERQMQAVDRAARNRAEEISSLCLDRRPLCTRARGERLLGFRHEHLRHQQRARRGHDHGGQQMLAPRRRTRCTPPSCRRKRAPCRWSSRSSIPTASASGRNGRIVSGASVCPMKMLAATLSDSAPLAPITRASPTRRRE